MANTSNFLTTAAKRFRKRTRNNGVMLVRQLENPADLGSRGGKVDESSELWLKGPPWLTKEGEWPEDIVTSPKKIVGRS